MRLKSAIPAHKRQSRSGITLVFTISILVLFLLMGTAFVIVANDYFKTASRRSQQSIYDRDPVALLDQAFYDVFRGVDFDVLSSPLRTHSILEDLYGYGFKGRLASRASFLPFSNDALVVIELDAGSFTSIRTGNAIAGYLSSDEYVDGLLNGRVISFIDGSAVGYSTRIVSHTHDETNNTLQMVIPRDSRGIQWDLVGSSDQFIVNGREYSGYGAGRIRNFADDPDAEAMPRFATDEVDGLIDFNAPTAARPNRLGESKFDLTKLSGFVPLDQSPNEPHDAPDLHNMFLSGSRGDEIIPSFHRDQLYDFQFNRTSGSVDSVSSGQIRRFSFRPVYVENDPGSTAQRPRQSGISSLDARSWFGRYEEDGAREQNVLVNNSSQLDVDSDLDGKNDAVWIDIGLQVQTDAQGRSYRPLVAYRIIDMDGRLNLNAHGSQTDIATGSAERYGMGFGVAEISLEGAVGNSYEDLLEGRYGRDKQPGAESNSLTPDFFASQKLFGYPAINRLTSLRFATACDLFASILLGASEDDPEALPEIASGVVVLDRSPYIGDFSLVGGVGDNHFKPHELEGLLRRNDVDSPQFSGWLARLPSSAIDQVTTHSFEIAIPAVPLSVTEMLRNRIAQTDIEEEDRRAVFDIFTSNSYRMGDPELEEETIYEMKYLSHEMLLGGRFNLNRTIGNGFDNNRDGVVDNEAELALGTESTLIPSIPETQYENPTFDLNNDPEINDRFAKQLMAKQLYILALLACGDAAPEGYPTGPEVEGVALTADELYRKSVAQWAVNVVDFYDTDSIQTAFEYDVNPFNDPRIEENLVDGDARTDEGTERGVVFGAERPEILLNETFAHHDRQVEDTDDDSQSDGAGGDIPGFTVADGDDDWDSRWVPQSSLYVELYHPHRQSLTSIDRRQGYQTLPAELSDEPAPANGLDSVVHGVDLGIVAPDETPVWRIAVHRGPEADNADEHVRTIYFVDPINSKAPSPNHDCFFPETEPPRIEPYSRNGRNTGDQFLVVGTSGNVGDGEQTFGRLQSTDPGDDPTIIEVNDTRAIILRPDGVTVRDFDARTGEMIEEDRDCLGSIIDQYRRGHRGTVRTRGLSLSDPDGGYEIEAGSDRRRRDGIQIDPARDVPYDGERPSGNRDGDDMDAIWTNGIRQDDDYQFRVLKLQRLANPLQPFHSVANPYITIDVANVDLLAFNGLQDNQENNATDVIDSVGTNYTVEDGQTAMKSIERGELIADEDDAKVARSKLYRAPGRIELENDLGRTIEDDGHNFSFGFTDGAQGGDSNRLETLGQRNAAHEETTQYSWLNWHNRPFTNHLEIANVPMLSSEGIVRHFNRNETETDPVGETSDADTAFSYFFGNDQFGHLMAFGSIFRDGDLRPNRFDRLLEMIEVPSRFLGSETFLRSRNNDGEPIFVPAGGPLKFNLHPPYHSIPNFRYPGKVNLNTVPDATVWQALVRGFGDVSFTDFSNNLYRRRGPTDFGGLFTTANAAEFADRASFLRKGADAGLFRTADDGSKLLDSVNSDLYDGGTDVDATAAFRNELRTRLGIAATTRSNVYAIWITVGYFEVDALGRLGAEMGEAEGEIQRNRAFYIVDRSIPVALEPGQNHNVDNAVLIRTIIQ